MRRIQLVSTAFLLLALMGCASTKRNQNEESFWQVDDALRSTLTQAAGSIPSDLFDALTDEELLGSKGADMARHQEIPLLSDQVAAWRGDVLEAFKAQIIEESERIEAYSQSLTLTDQDALVQSQDAAMTTLFWGQDGRSWKEALTQSLSEKLKQTNEDGERMLSTYTIWQQGKAALTGNPVPDVRLPSNEELADLFLGRYYSALKAAEIDVRTTPQPLGIGSLYEFYLSNQQNIRD